MIKNRPVRLMRAEEVFTEYCHTLPAGVPIEDALKPETWDHVAKQLRQWDRIRVIAEDGAFEAMLVVIASQGAYVRLAELYRWELPANDAAAAPESAAPTYKVAHHPTLKWRVIRIADGEVMKDQMPERTHAETWIREHERVLERT